LDEWKKNILAEQKQQIEAEENIKRIGAKQTVEAEFPSAKSEPALGTATFPQRNAEAEVQEPQVEANKIKPITPPTPPIIIATVATETSNPTPNALYLSGVKAGKKIGEGNFGKVFIGEWSKIEVALKSFKQSLEDVEKEISTFQ
jgi:hypothetical protein